MICTLHGTGSTKNVWFKIAFSSDPPGMSPKLIEPPSAPSMVPARALAPSPTGSICWGEGEQPPIPETTQPSSPRVELDVPTAAENRATVPPEAIVGAVWSAGNALLRAGWQQVVAPPAPPAAPIPWMPPPNWPR
jgi:hypothetical protein